MPAGDWEVQFVFHKADAERVLAWPCVIDVPLTGGKIERQHLVARFKVLPRDQVRVLTDPLNMVRAVAERALAGGGAEGVEHVAADLPTDPNGAIVDAALQGFVDLKDETGRAVPDADAIALFRQLDYAVIGLARGFFEMMQGRLPKN